MSTFVDVSTLRELLASDRPPVVLRPHWRHLGSKPEEILATGSAPMAVHVDLDDDLSGAPGDGGRHPLPESDDFARAMRRAGVTLDRPVVIADAGDGVIAGRLWWLLRHFGHDEVVVLDGGHAAWIAEGGELVATPSQPPYGDDGPESDHPFVAAPGRLVVLDADGAASAARSGVLLDARAPARYAGEVEPIDAVAGHIPGALNAPTAMSVAPDHRLRPREVVVSGFANLGVTPGVEVAAYCGSGVTAAHTVMVLHEIGIEAALYVGSWSQWIRDPARPIATGSSPE